MTRATSRITRGATTSGLSCACKQLRPEDIDREDLGLRLQNEAGVLTYLAGTHGVIRLLEVRNVPLMLMLEWADGGSLDDRLEAGISPGDRRLISRDLVRAVAACHARGVVHRDIKPSNILFVAGSLRLADFGVAAWGTPPRALPEGWEEDDVGTPPWSAPELRAHATGVVHPAADVYSVAMVLRALCPRGTSDAVAAALSEDPDRRPPLRELGRGFD